MKVLIACGGTGGHLFPGLAVAETLVSRQHQVRLLVSEKSVDRVAVQSLPAGRGSSVDVTTMSAVGYAGSRQLIRFCSRLAGATRDCARLSDEFEPDAVLGMGGFTSAPALLAARWQSMRRGRRNGCATLIHESNAIPGKANLWAGRMVDHVALGMSGCATFFGKNRVTVTGTPVRADKERERLFESGAEVASIRDVSGAQNTIPALQSWNKNYLERRLAPWKKLFYLQIHLASTRKLSEHMVRTIGTSLTLGNEDTSLPGYKIIYPRPHETQAWQKKLKGLNLILSGSLLPFPRLLEMADLEEVFAVMRLPYSPPENGFPDIRFKSSRHP